MAELSNVELLQIKGAPGKPYTIVGDPTTAPGVAANVGSYGFDGSVYWQKWGTTDTDWKPITGTYSYQTDEDYYKFRASSLMASPRLTCWWWDDFLEPTSEKWITSLSATGTWTTKYNDCGVSRFAQTNPGASGDLRSYVAMGNIFDTSGNFIPGNGTWYVAFRAKINFTASSHFQITLDCLNTDSAGRMYFGEGNAVDGKWAIFTNEDGVVYSSVVNDGATHIHEVYRVGGNTYYLLDGVQILSGNYYPHANALYISMYIQSAGVDVTKTCDIDWLCAAVGGNNARTIT
jgi:hypothetical protein